MFEYPASGACEALLLFVSVVYPYNESMNPLLDLHSNESNARVCKFASACCRLEWRTNENLVCRLSNCRSLRASALHTALGPSFTRVKTIKKARSPATEDLQRRRRNLSTYKRSFTRSVASIRLQHTQRNELQRLSSSPAHRSQRLGHRSLCPEKPTPPSCLHACGAVQDRTCSSRRSQRHRQLPRQTHEQGREVDRVAHSKTNP